MRDPRLDQLARVLVRYSTDVQPGQLVRIAGDAVGLPLIEAVYEEVLRAGGHPFVKLSTQAMQDAFFELAGEGQLAFLSPLSMAEVEAVDVAIGLWADVNTKAMSRVDASRQAIAASSRKPYMQTFFERAARGELRWTGTQFPTEAAAQDAEMSLRQYADFVYRAGHLHLEDPAAKWREISAQQQKVVDRLNGSKHLRFESAGGTDLHVDVEGMTWINCDGHENFPDGEVFTGPNLDAGPDSPSPGGVNGVVHYSFPAVYHGREVHDIVLTFERGRVVDAKASKNQAYLRQMLAMDDGASRLGEIAIGTNYAITEYTRNTLFDEKIGGTFHAAVGSGYPETGNRNASGLHWDMVCDLRPDAGGGSITVDGEVISRDGRFLFEGWPGNG